MRDSYVSLSSNKIPESGLKEFFGIMGKVEGIISLGVGEPDFETPDYARKAAVKAIQNGDTKYTDTMGLIELRQAISDYLKERFQLTYKADSEVLVTVGASEGIDLALKVLTDPEDEVLLVEPSYVSYHPCITLCQAKTVVLTSKAENRFKLTKEELREKLTKNSKVLILPYPSNPTGAIMTKEDLEAIAEVVLEHDLFVISDEIYGELTYKKEHISIASLPGMRERTLVLSGFSKAFAMTGWRLGYAAGPADVIEAMHRIHQYTVMVAPTMSQYAGIAALTHKTRDKDIDQMRNEYDERRMVLVEGFHNMGLECFEPEGAFYVFPSIKNTGMTSAEFSKKLIEEEKVAVIPGSAFGVSGEGFIRCSYAYSIENIKECLKRIEHFISVRFY